MPRVEMASFLWSRVIPTDTESLSRCERDQRCISQQNNIEKNRTSRHAYPRHTKGYSLHRLHARRGSQIEAEREGQRPSYPAAVSTSRNTLFGSSWLTSSSRGSKISHEGRGGTAGGPAGFGATWMTARQPSVSCCGATVRASGEGGSAAGNAGSGLCIDPRHARLHVHGRWSNEVVPLFDR